MKSIFKNLGIIASGIAVLSLFEPLQAQPVATLNDVDPYEAGGNYYSYPWMNETPPTPTSTPEGYIPYHFEHYGRHGSRWHIGDYNYSKSFEILSKAKRDGKLTPLGETLFEEVIKIKEEFDKGRDGELSDKGAVQHYGIGQRMASNYPEIFNPISDVDARSTVVIRCILSMQNGLKGIQSKVPGLKVKTDASHADMWYMNFSDTVAWNIQHRADSLYLKPFLNNHKNKGEYLSKIINDPVYAKDSIGEVLANPLFSLLVNTQSHFAQPWLLEEIFTPEEIRERWLGRNAHWFIRSGNSKITDYRMPYTQANLLTNIIESADTALMNPSPSANLRYGHDSVVLPLACLLEIDNFGEEINDLEELADKGWHDYLVIPMGGNIQMVFYRPKTEKFKEEDILVKVLLNEKEVTLPIGRGSGPYYKWTDLKNYYLEKMQNFSNSN